MQVSSILDVFTFLRISVSLTFRHTGSGCFLITAGSAALKRQVISVWFAVARALPFLAGELFPALLVASSPVFPESKTLRAKVWVYTAPLWSRLPQTIVLSLTRNKNEFEKDNPVVWWCRLAKNRPLSVKKISYSKFCFGSRKSRPVSNIFEHSRYSWGRRALNSSSRVSYHWVYNLWSQVFNLR